jgi:hypothetical protein
MRRWKAISLLAVLLLSGCMAEATSLDLEEGDTLEALQQKELSQVGAEPAPTPPTNQQATPGSAWNPGAAVATTPGGKPQPDPWRDRAATSNGPSKPQPDPWSPLDHQTQHIK